MKGKYQLLFDAVYEDLIDLCDTLGGKIHIADALIMKDDFLSALDDYSKDVLQKNLVACLHIAHSSQSSVMIATDKNENTARARFWAPKFEFLTKELISLCALIVYAKSIALDSQEGTVVLTVDFPVSFDQ